MTRRPWAAAVIALMVTWQATQQPRLAATALVAVDATAMHDAVLIDCDQLVGVMLFGERLQHPREHNVTVVPVNDFHHRSGRRECGQVRDQFLDGVAAMVPAEVAVRLARQAAQVPVVAHDRSPMALRTSASDVISSSRARADRQV
jgi:hypothetical protein